MVPAETCWWSRTRVRVNGIAQATTRIVESSILTFLTIVKLQFVEPGFAINAETRLQPLLMGYNIKEVPISWINRTPHMGLSSFRLMGVGGG
ncbi:MAG: hypothetical protein WD688_02945 [Candidatus Binatia bacterium]